MDNNEESMKIWLNRYLRIQAKTDTKVSAVLSQAAADAYKELTSLDSKKSFSEGVKSARLRIAMQVIKEILNDSFGKLPPILQDGNRNSARAAVTAFGESDRRYLEAAFADTGISINDILESQRRQAALSVGNAVRKLQGIDKPLSERVYRTRFQATTWVRNQVTRDIALQRSAREIALHVRSSIRTSTPGGVSYAAMRLGRTELNNAFHATSVDLAKDRPWVEGMRWHLSKTHKPEKPCNCQRLAGRVFPTNETPAKPHPQCRCYVTPELPPVELFISRLTSGSYQDWIENAA